MWLTVLIDNNFARKKILESFGICTCLSLETKKICQQVAFTLQDSFHVVSSWFINVCVF